MTRDHSIQVPISSWVKFLGLLFFFFLIQPPLQSIRYRLIWPTLTQLMKAMAIYRSAWLIQGPLNPKTDRSASLNLQEEEGEGGEDFSSPRLCTIWRWLPPTTPYQITENKRHCCQHSVPNTKEKDRSGYSGFHLEPVPTLVNAKPLRKLSCSITGKWMGNNPVKAKLLI